MSRIKKIIILLLALIMIIIVILKLNTNKNKENIVEGLENDGKGLEKEYIDYTVYPVNTPSVYYTVEECIQKYLACISLNVQNQIYNSSEFSILDEIKNNQEKYDAIFNMLNRNYTRKNNITTQNLEDYIKVTNIPLTFTALEMNNLEINNIRLYSVYGRVEESSTGKFVDNVYFKVILDINNMTFSIEPIENCNNITQIKLEKELDYIEANNYNTYEYIKITEKDLINNYISYYKTTALKYPNEIYENLDEEYKKSKFPSEEEFKNYVENKKESIQSLVLDRYTKKEYDNYTQYTCIDTNGNYYIFKQKAIMQFDILLDN